MANPSGLITVLTDTREQRPWSLDPTRFVTERATLQTGDYTVKGLEDRLCIERKGLGDFVGTVISDWIRFRKELYRLASFDFALIVVEADLGDVYAHRYESDANPESVVGRANAIFLDHGIQVAWWGSRSHCVSMTENFLAMAVKKLGGLVAANGTGGEESWGSPTVKIESSPSGSVSPSRTSRNNGSRTVSTP